jgi:hypothetical protein
MASYAYTFTSGDTVTPTKLNNARTISNIVNADVSATAAIAGSKIAPTFTAQVTVPNGSAAAPSIRLTSEASGLYRAGTGFLGVSANGEAIGFFTPASSTFHGGRFILNSGASNELALFCTQVNTGGLIFSGHDGLAAGGQIRVYGGSHATKPNFVELTSGNTVRMTVNDTGRVGIGTASPASRLHLAGPTGVGAILTVQDNQGAGNAASPYLQFQESSGTRLGYIGYPAANSSALVIHNDANDAMQFWTNATARVTISAAGDVGIGNSSPAVKLDVTGDINTSEAYGVDGVQVVANRRTGWTAATGTATRTSFATSTVTTEQLAQRVKALIDDLATHGLIGS